MGEFTVGGVVVVVVVGIVVRIVGLTVPTAIRRILPKKQLLKGLVMVN